MRLDHVLWRVEMVAYIEGRTQAEGVLSIEC